MRKIIDSFPPLVKFFFAISLSIIAVGLVFSLGLLMESQVTGFSITEVLARISQPGRPGSIPVIRFVLALQTVVVFALPPFVFAFVYGQDCFKSFHLTSVPPKTLLVYTILIMFISFPFVNLLSDVNGWVIDGMLGPDNSLKLKENAAETLVLALIKDSSPWGLPLNIIVMALLPALIEELFFRGLLQNFLLRNVKNIHATVLISGFIFSFIHFQFYGFIPRMLLGMFFGYLLVWGGSLWIPIVAHFINNLIAVVGYSLISKGFLPEAFEKFGTTNNCIFAGFISGLIVAFLLYLILLKYKTTQILKTN